MKNRNHKDVVYPCRLTKELFQRVQQMADEHDLKASHIIRMALRQMFKAQGPEQRSADPNDRTGN